MFVFEDIKTAGEFVSAVNDMAGVGGGVETQQSTWGWGNNVGGAREFIPP